MTIKQTIGVLIAAALVVVIAVAIGKYQEPAPTAQIPTDQSIAGCYVATLDKDVYTLTIASENNGEVQGTVSFKNYQKDSSNGTFIGTYTNGMLVGDYEFDSEGMHSIRELAFKKVDNGFVEGFGDVEVVDNRETLKDTSNLSYDTSFTFIKQPTCGQ